MTRRRRVVWAAALAAGMGAAALAAVTAGRIDTAAGTGQPVNNLPHGQGGDVASVNIGQPFGVEFGPDGRLYVCEVENHRVLAVDLGRGRVTVAAGSGRKGYGGDGGPATDAMLNEPYEVRFDAKGNMYFVEMRNHVVRRVDASSGVISTVAGTGQSGYGGDGGPAVKAILNQPHSIALDEKGGHLYIADIGNHRIRRVDLRGGLIETIAGTGEKSLPVDGVPAKGRAMLGPRALYWREGVLWIALREGHSVWRLTLSDGVLHHVAGTGRRGFTGDGGDAKQATFDGPKGIALDEAGNVYVVDTENHAIRRIDAGSGVVTTLAGIGPTGGGYGGDGGPATAAKLARPHGVCVGPRAAVYIGDTNNHRVRVVEQER